MTGVSVPARRVSTSTSSTAYVATKRAIDVALVIALLPVAVPLIATAAVAVILTTRQNPFFLQTRVGLRGRSFRMLKLRTMRVTSPGPAGAKTPDDPRVTGIGRLLRRTSLDELPQLLNVLAGQMSLVGPRPALPSEVAENPELWRRSVEVKPGLTGLWQVRGRSELSPRRRAALDRCYIRHRSLGFDALVMLSTLRAVFSMRGAW